jgi:hypothetical protein
MAKNTQNHRAVIRGKHRSILATFLAALVSLCLGPLGARAQTLYVTDPSRGSVGAYNATTGALINATLITGATLNSPTDIGLAISGNTLYLPKTPYTVATYNATTGAAINVNFAAGNDHPVGLAISGNSLFVVNDAPWTARSPNTTLRPERQSTLPSSPGSSAPEDSNRLTRKASRSQATTSSW